MSVFHADRTARYVEQGKELMVTSEKVPSLAIATHAFGKASVSTLIKSYLFVTAKALGLQADEENIALIAQDIIEGFPDFKITDVMLALAMMRQGKFRIGQDGVEDASRFFGSLSSEIVCNALYRYRKEVRNVILEKAEKERHEKELERAELHKATYEEKRESLANACLKDDNIYLLDMIKKFGWLKENDIKAIENAMEEIKALRLLRDVVKEYIEKVNSGCDPKNSIKRLENGIKYLEEHFPTTKKEEQ